MAAEDLEIVRSLVRLSLEEEPVELCLLDLARLDGSGSSPDPAALGFLTPEERGEYERLRHPGRRSEWLGARICLKGILLGRGSISDPLQCTIRKDGRGRPWLAFAPGFPRSAVVDCSLSHKAGYACGCVSGAARTRVGIDVERATGRLLKMKHVFVHERDSLLGSDPPEVRLAVLWALKEACSKALGLGIGLGLSDVICEETAEGRHRLRIDEGAGLPGGGEFTAIHFVHQGYVIALCLMREEACATVA